MPEIAERVKPYKGQSLARLIKLIKDAQPFPFPQTATIELGVPTTGAGEGITEIDATAVISQDKRQPTVGLTYIRLSLDVLKNLPEGEILSFDDVVFPTSTHKILDVINHRLGLDLLATEVEDTDLPTRPSEMPVRILEGNYAWIPGLYHFPMLHIPSTARITMDNSLRVTQSGRIRIISVKGS